MAFASGAGEEASGGSALNRRINSAQAQAGVPFRPLDSGSLLRSLKDGAGAPSVSECVASTANMFTVKIC
jgi:hypothetical protein